MITKEEIPELILCIAIIGAMMFGQIEWFTIIGTFVAMSVMSVRIYNRWKYREKLKNVLIELFYVEKEIFIGLDTILEISEEQANKSNR
jgi:hypothetical protein